MAERTRGTLILTVGRSGSNWLMSLTNSTELLGTGREWFSKDYLGPKLPATQDELINTVISRSSTANGYFCIKIFPSHLHYIQIKYGFDVIHYLWNTFDVNLVSLTRRDRERQAISYARAIQTQQWTASRSAKIEAYYDFEAICRCYALIDQSYQYWKTYTELRSIRPAAFYYEELLAGPEPFINNISAHAGVKNIREYSSKHSIQRDSTTEEWLERFRHDVTTRGIVDFTTPSRPAAVTLSNLTRFLRKKQMKPYPYYY